MFQIIIFFTYKVEPKFFAMAESRAHVVVYQENERIGPTWLVIEMQIVLCNI